MICPNCGTENLGERRSCVKCSNDLPVSVATANKPRVGVESPTTFELWVAELADENLIDQIPVGSGSGFSDTLSESDLWPPESVFVPTAETPHDEAAAIAERESAELAFEDDQADDFFEQSLSGLRLSNFDAIDTVSEPIADPEIAPEPETVPEPRIDPEPEIAPEPEIVPELRVDPKPEIIPEPEIVPEHEIVPPAGREIASVEQPAPVEKRKWGRVILRVVGLFLFAALLFGAGLGTGILLLGIPESQIPNPTSIELFVEEPDPNSPPPGMAYVPGGEFLMGSDTADVLSMPAHKVEVAPFFVDVTEVTNEAYLDFVKATGHTPPARWENGTFPNGEGKFPVTGVSWYDAVQFAAWAGKRLPTEAEWEFAARGTDDRIYPWGNEWDSTLANANNTSEGIRNVGEGGRSPFGLFDMSGNAWEWTKSDTRSYPGGKPFPWSKLRLKIIRGGNWQSGPNTATAVFRGYYGAIGEREYNGTGFRCVKDVARE